MSVDAQPSSGSDSRPGDPLTTGASDPRRWRALAVLCLVQVMLVLDITVVNVALPPIQHDLGFSQSGLAWVVNGYALTFGGLLLLGGRLADLAGRRRIFLVGLALFAAASATAGLAVDPGMLVAGRFVQGVGGALVSPAALSLVTVLFPDPGERTKALSIWGGLGGVGGTLGNVLSGVLSEYASWRWVFFINLPIALIALALAPRLLNESRAERRPRLDVPGAVLATLGLSAVVYGLLDKGLASWISAHVLVPLGCGVALLAAFVLVEARSREPMVPLSFFASRQRSVANTVVLLVSAAFAAMFFTLALYLEQIQHFSPLRTGFAFLPLGAAFIAGVGVSSQLVPRVGLKPVVVAGMAVAAVGGWLFSGVSVGGTYLDHVLPGMLVLPLGAAAAFIGATIAAVGDATDEDAGLSGGVNNTAQQVGNALGLATLVSLAVTRSTDMLRHGADPAHAATSGFALTFGAAAVLFAAAALVALLGLRHRAPAPPAENAR